MARNAIESEFRTSKMSAGGHLKKKSRIDLKWPEMCHFVIFKQIKVAYRSEIARNAFKSEFRTFKMGAGGHFVKKEFRIDLKWPEMPSKVSF